MESIERRNFAGLELRADESQPIQIVGYPAVFGAWSEDLGGFREIIRPGAFARTLAAGADVRFLVNHDGAPLARTRSGTMSLTEDDRGLRMVAMLSPTDPEAVSLAEKIRRGDIDQMSFAFRAIRDSWDYKTSTRELLDVELIDVSAVTYPAYPDASIGLRGLRAHQVLSHQNFERRRMQLQLLSLVR
ncbi:MAG: HK97 family phage prohead protease [Caulobacteraceae bacterium]|nr:HK97 family phage prohead protease [Caulobacteraceae bacterium]